jgi:hypothetical protein
LSDFWDRMDDAFGASYARSVARDQVLSGLGGRTIEQSLAQTRDDALSIKAIWRVVCADLEVPARLR